MISIFKAKMKQLHHVWCNLKDSRHLLNVITLSLVFN